MNKFNEIDKYCYHDSSEWINNTHYNASECYEEEHFYNHTYLDYIVDGVMLPLVGVFGILGNICGIIHFGKNRHQTYYSLMFALAFSDITTILAFMVYHSLPIAFNPRIFIESLMCTHIMHWTYPILYISQLTGIYLTISVCIERYFAICRPLTHRIRRRSSYTYIIPIICVSVIYNLPVFFEFTVNTATVGKWKSNNISMTFVGNTTIYFAKGTRLGNSSLYRQIYSTGTKLIFKCIIPYICLISLNVLIVKTLYGVRYTLSNDDMNDEKINKERNNDRQRKATVSSIGESDPLYVHVSDKQQCLRRSQVDLAFVNLAIAAVFLISYSLIWVWAIYDFIYTLLPETERQVSNKRSNKLVQQQSRKL